MSFVVRGNNVYKSLSGVLFPGTARYVNAQTILKDHHSLNIFAETMSFDEDRVKPSGEESKAEGDSGNGANQLKVSEKEIRKGNEPQERKTPTSQITGEENDKGKKAPAPKPKKADDERKFSSNTYRKEGEGDQSADESPEKGGDEQQSDPHEGLLQKIINNFHLDTKSRSILFSLVGIFLAAAVAYSVTLPKKGVKTDFNLVRVFEIGLPELRSSFTNQSDRFWKILESRGLAHLRNKDPSQPLVFLLAAPPAAYECVDYLAIKLAELLDPGHKRDLARIDGEKERANSPNKSKLTMDNFLKKKIEDSHRVVLIHHLELLPPPSPLLFHNYCDDQNAPDKHLAFIFTVHMPEEPSPSLSPEEAEGSVEKYLSGDVWAKEDKDAIAALLVRIADTVLLMNGETCGSA